MRVRRQARLQEVFEAVHAETLSEVAEEFDSIHRAKAVGSVHHLLPPQRLRPYVIEAA